MHDGQFLTHSTSNRITMVSPITSPSHVSSYHDSHQRRRRRKRWTFCTSTATLSPDSKPHRSRSACGNKAIENGGVISMQPISSALSAIDISDDTPPQVDTTMSQSEMPTPPRSGKSVLRSPLRIRQSSMSSVGSPHHKAQKLQCIEMGFYDAFFARLLSVFFEKCAKSHSQYCHSQEPILSS